MARFAVWALAWAAGVCAVVGCQPAKEIPDVVPKGTEPSDAPKVPTVSDPAAKEYVAKAVTKFTGGKPELLAKGKASRVAYKGLMPQLSGENPAARTIAAVWPDRYFTATDLTAQGKQFHIRVWLHRPRITVWEGENEQDVPNRPESELTLAADGTAQHWMALLTPLTDPNAVVYDLQSVTGLAPGTGQPMPVQVLKLSLGTLPPFQLTFDAKTDLLLRVEYVARERGVTYRKQWTVLEHKPGPEGLMLPAKTEVRHDGQVVEQWTVEKWEFPATIDDAEFSPPKK
jgi:hypothetical protein